MLSLLLLRGFQWYEHIIILIFLIWINYVITKTADLVIFNLETQKNEFYNLELGVKYQFYPY